jgi:hypothetical protein
MLFKWLYSDSHRGPVCCAVNLCTPDALPPLGCDALRYPAVYVCSTTPGSNNCSSISVPYKTPDSKLHQLHCRSIGYRTMTAEIRQQ